MCPTVTVPLQIDRAATRLTVPAQSYRETRRHTTGGGETLPRMVDVSSGRHPPFNFSHGPRTRSGATGPSRSDRLHLDAGNDQLGDRLGPRDAGVVEAGLTLDLAVLVGRVGRAGPLHRRSVSGGHCRCSIARRPADDGGEPVHSWEGGDHPSDTHVLIARHYR